MFPKCFPNPAPNCHPIVCQLSSTISSSLPESLYVSSCFPIMSQFFPLVTGLFPTFLPFVFQMLSPARRPWSSIGLASVVFQLSPNFVSVFQVWFPNCRPFVFQLSCPPSVQPLWRMVRCFLLKTGTETWDPPWNIGTWVDKFG